MVRAEDFCREDFCRHRVPVPEDPQGWQDQWEDSPRTALRRAIDRRLKSTVHDQCGPGEQQGVNVIESLTGALHPNDLPVVTFSVSHEKRGEKITFKSRRTEMQASVLIAVNACPEMGSTWGTVDDRIDWLLHLVEGSLQNLTVPRFGELYTEVSEVSLSEGLKNVSVPTVVAVQEWQITGVVVADQGKRRRAMAVAAPLPPPAASTTATTSRLDVMLSCYQLPPRMPSETDDSVRARLRRVRTVGWQDKLLSAWDLEARAEGEGLDAVDRRLMAHLMEESRDGPRPTDRQNAMVIDTLEFRRSGGRELRVPGHGWQDGDGQPESP